MATTSALANGQRLAYESFGSSRNPAVVLIAGLSTQMTAWPALFCQLLARSGYYVVRFDNRDCGLSQKSGERGPGPLGKTQLLMRNAPAYRIAAGIHETMGLKRAPHPSRLLAPRLPYSLSDLAADVIGLLDALGLPRAHLIGASMGGVIAQHCAFEHAERVCSLTAIMSTSGEALLPGPSLALRSHFASRQPREEEAIIRRGIKTLRLVQGSRYRESDEQLRSRVEGSYRRAHHPEGAPRHLFAIAGSRPWVSRLPEIIAPALVVHGSEDPLLKPVCGRSLARRIPGARFDLVEGLGHDLPAMASRRLLHSIGPHLSVANR